MFSITGKDTMVLDFCFLINTVFLKDRKSLNILRIFFAIRSILLLVGDVVTWFATGATV